MDYPDIPKDNNFKNKHLLQSFFEKIVNLLNANTHGARLKMETEGKGNL